MTGHLRRGYLFDTFEVKSYDPETNIAVFDFDNARFEGTFPLSDEDCLRYADEIFFQNLSCQLDTEGEYWYNPDNGYLYVYKPSGRYTISYGDSESSLITIDSGADHISFVGLAFDGSPCKVMYSEGNDITVNGCEFTNVRGLAVLEFRKAKNVTVENCEFANFVNCAVIVAEASDIKRLISGNTVITNNYFHDFGTPQYFVDSVAVSLYDTVAGLVSHNVFLRGAHGGVELNECIDTVIEYNVFDKLIMTTGDYGAVYTYWSVAFRSNIIRYNLFCNIMGAPGYGIYIDDMSAEQEIYGNVFYNGGVHAVTLNGGRDNIIRDNAIIVTLEYKRSTNADFLMYGDGLYDVNKRSWIGGWIERTKYKPAEGEDGYELWLQRWPLLYNYNTDINNAGDVNCVFTTINYIRNNAMIGASLAEQDPSKDTTYDRFGVLENNVSYDRDENPIFVNPALGDYSIRSDVGFFDNHFSEMGRK